MLLQGQLTKYGSEFLSTAQGLSNVHSRQYSLAATDILYNLDLDVAQLIPNLCSMHEVLRSISSTT